MSGDTCILFNVQRFSTEDGPGIRTTLFFKGCPLACPWCHNPEGIGSRPEPMWQAALCLGCGDCAAACPRHAIRLTEVTVDIDRDRCKGCGTCADACPTGGIELMGRQWRIDDLLAEVLKDRAFYTASGGGVTLSGGEPLAQHEFVLRFAPRCRAEGLHVALDTSGFARGEWMDAALSCINLVLFDLKLIDPVAHERLTGVPLDVVLDNLDRVVASGLPIWVRTPVIPGCTDSQDNLRGIARHLRDRVPSLERLDLLAFSNLCTSKYEMLDRGFALADVPLLKPQTMERLTDLVRAEGIEVVHWSGPTRTDGQHMAEDARRHGVARTHSGAQPE